MPARRVSPAFLLLLPVWFLPKDLRAQDQCPGGGVYVTPDGGTDTVTANANNTVSFSVQAAPSNGDCVITVALLPSGASVSNVNLENPGQSPLTLYSGDAASVGVSFDIGASQSQGTLYLEAQGWWGAGSDNGSRNVVAQANGPVVALQDYNQDYLDVTKCAANCFDAVASYATEPHFGQNITHAPASLQLMYRSSLAHPMGVVQFNSWDTTAVYPTKMSVRLQDEQGGWVRFANTSYEMFFACPTSPNSCNSNLNRLAVQFDVSAKATGAYLYTLTVRSWRPDGSSIESVVGLRVLIENEATSRFGAGWTLAGVQRVYPGIYPLDGVAITEGNGSIVYFALAVPGCTGNCSYQSPPTDGDLTVVTGHYGTGSTYIKWDRRYPDGTTFNFYPDGRLAYVRDRFGNKTTVYTYDGSNRLVGIGDTIPSYNDGVLHRLDWYTLNYDPNSKLSGITSQVAHGVSVAINGTTGNLTNLQGPLPGSTPGVFAFQGSYDNQHRLTQWTDRRGGVWDIHYDFAGKVDTAKAPTIRADSANSGSKPSIRPITKYASLESVMLVNPASGLGSTESPAPARKADTLRARVTNPRGYATTYALNRFGQATRVEEPLGRTTRFTFDGEGRHMIDSTASGLLIRYTWSGPNMTQQRDSFTTRTINYAYDAAFNLLTRVSGDVDSVSYAVNSVSHHGFPAYTIVDSTWRGKWKADSTEVMRGISWDAGYPEAQCVGTWRYRFHQCRYRGQKYNPYDPGNTDQGLVNDSAVITIYQEDLPNGPPLARISTLYDWTGRPVRTITRVSAAKADTTWKRYDTRGRDSLVIGALHDTTKYFYDALYLTQVNDAKGQVYRVWPNALGWPDSTKDPAGAMARFYYDLNGNVDSVVNRRGQRIKQWHDALDHDILLVAGTDTTWFTMDPQDRFKTAKNKESTDTVRFDSAGRKVAEITCRALPTVTCFKDSSEFDRRDLRTKVMVSSSPTLWATHTASFYYNASRILLDSMTNLTNETMTFGYTRPTGRDSTRTFRTLNLTQTFAHTAWIEGTSAISFSDDSLNHTIGSAYRYDEAGRITQLFHGRVATPDTARSAVLDPGGRLTAYADTNATGWNQGCTVDWAATANADYSDTRLGEACGTRSGWTFVDSARYVYDAVGNRVDSLAVTLTAVTSGNRLVRWKNFRMDYDADGNLTRKRTLQPDTTKVFETDSLFWSPLGRLDSLKIFDDTGKVLDWGYLEFGYDGWGRRVRKSTRGYPTSVTRFLWDGDDLVFELDTTGRRQAYWTFYPGTHEPQSVAFTSSSGVDTTLYYVTDALHNVVATLKANGGTGLVHSQYRYGPFGDSLALTGPYSKGDYVRYKGALYDGIYQGPRFYLMGARYYDPDVGRFISEDPIGLEGGINLYTFAENDPVNGWDPSGTFSLLTLASMVCKLAVNCPAIVLDAIAVTAHAPCLAARCDAMQAQTWNDPLLIAVSLFADAFLLSARGGAALVARQAAAAREATGPLEAWLRIRPTYSKTYGIKTWGVSWGSNAAHVERIGSPTLRAVSGWIREVRIPHWDWRFTDPGHIHFFPWLP